jgi:hypothetical protein
VGLTTDGEQLKNLVVRVGAPEYEPAESIKEFTLQARCQEIANSEHINWLEDEKN